MVLNESLAPERRLASHYGSQLEEHWRRNVEHVQSFDVQTASWFLGRPDLATGRALKDRDEEEDKVEHGVYDDQALSEPVADIATDGAEDSKDQEQDGTFCVEDRDRVDNVSIIGVLAYVNECVIISAPKASQDPLSSDIGLARNRYSTYGYHHLDRQHTNQLLRRP